MREHLYNEKFNYKQEDVDVLNLPPRSKKHKPKLKKERNQLFMSQVILKTILVLFIILIIFIPIAYYFWLQ